MTAFDFTWTGRAVSDNRRTRPVVISGRSRQIATSEYRDFKTGLSWAAKAELMRTRHPGFGKVKVFVDLEVRLPRRMDTPAVVKACLDALELAGVYDDDNQVQVLQVNRTGDSTDVESSQIRFYVTEKKAP